MGSNSKLDRSGGGLAKEMMLEGCSCAPKPHGRLRLRSRHDQDENELMWAWDGEAASPRQHDVSRWDLQITEVAFSPAKGG